MWSLLKLCPFKLYWQFTYISVDKWQLSGKSTRNWIQPLLRGVKVMLCCLKRRIKNLSVILLKFYTTLKLLIPLKMGTRVLRCLFFYSNVVYAKSCDIQQFRTNYVYLTKYFYTFLQFTQLPELCCQKSVFFLVWCLLPKQSSKHLLPSLSSAAAGSLRQTTRHWKARLQEYECSTCWHESTMNVLISIKRWSECALPLVYDTILNASV